MTVVSKLTPPCKMETMFPLISARALPVSVIPMSRIKAG